MNGTSGNPPVGDGGANNNANDGGGEGGMPPPAQQQGQQPPQPRRGQQQQGQESLAPTQAQVDLWNAVAEGLSKHQTVVWSKAVDSLENARSYLAKVAAHCKNNPSMPDAASDPNAPNAAQIVANNPAREFITKYMVQIISILLEQSPMKIGQMEKDCVEKSLRCALVIVKDDLEFRVEQDATLLESSLATPATLPPVDSLQALVHIFSKKKNYYRTTRNFNSNFGGMPEVRNQMISVFRKIRGFRALLEYLSLRAGSSTFPKMELCKEFLGAVWEIIPSASSGSGGNNNQNGGNGNGGRGDEGGGGVNSQMARLQAIREEVRSIAKNIMNHILLLGEITLKKIEAETIKAIRMKLYMIYNRLSGADGGRGGNRDGNPQDPYLLREFFEFWRSLALKLITSSSLPLKLLGWDNIVEIISESELLAPPPRAYLVKGAGTAFINGLFEFDPKRIMSNGYKQPNVDLQYHRKVPSAAENDSNASQPAIGPAPPPPEGAGKTLTLFRCTMRSQHKWWFLSEADADQPGTDKDIDYYQHKSNREEENLPSELGWLTCRSGADPPPTLEAVGMLVPPGEEHETLEHLLARWAIENNVVELVLGDGIHREIVSRSTDLIKFLAGMSERGDNDSTMEDDDSKKHCLQASHLLLAWKTCTNKADAAVSAQIYQLLVSILPNLSSALAIPLIEAIHDSLDAPPESSPRNMILPKSSSGDAGDVDGSGKSGDHFFEVSEFCCAIAEKMLPGALASNNKSSQDASSASNKASKGESKVREAILSLQWAVLSHRQAPSLKSYESIKRFVSTEICKQDATTVKLRMQFLVSCRTELSRNASITGTITGTSRLDPAATIVDENHALHMCQLAKFLLEGYGREEMEQLVAYNPHEPENHLPTLFLKDLVSYMKRRRNRTSLVAPPVRKHSSNTAATPEFNHSQSLTTRLQILRYVYGLLPATPTTSCAGSSVDSQVDPSKISATQLDHLWNVCVAPDDREVLMAFLANASRIDGGNSSGANVSRGLRLENAMHNIPKLEPAITDNVYVFTKLFCAVNLGWEQLGEAAYNSFREFDAKESRESNETTDALWRICLEAGNGEVAGNAMKDLLSVYTHSSNAVEISEDGSIKVKEDESSNAKASQFSQRIFDCLTQVKDGMQRGDPSSERNAERCIRILSAAIEQCDSLGGNASSVAQRLESSQKQQMQSEEDSPPDVSHAMVENYLNLVPHGMRGMYSCGTVSVQVRVMGSRRGASNNSENPSSMGEGGKSHPDSFTLQIHPLQTLGSIKLQIATKCNHDEKCLKLNNFSGRASRAEVGPTQVRPNLSSMPDSSLAADLGISEGTEIMAVLADKPQMGGSPTASGPKEQKPTVPQTPPSSLDLTELFAKYGFFDTLIAVLEALPRSGPSKTKSELDGAHTHTLVWDLLFAMPTNAGIIASVHAAAATSLVEDCDNMVDERTGNITSDWSSLLDFGHFERSVYVMQILDSYLRPATHMFTSVSLFSQDQLAQSMVDMAAAFRARFIQSGGFEAVLHLFILSGKSNNMERRNRMGNECALRIINECFFAKDELSTEGRKMIESFARTSGDFLKSLVAFTIGDSGVSDNAILRVLKLVRMLLESGPPTITTSFTSLPGNAAETFLTSLLLWKGSGFLASTGRSAKNIRKSTEEMILAIPMLFASALPWLVKSLNNIDPSTDGSDEFFSVLLKLVQSVNRSENAMQLKELGSAVCLKLASYPRPNNDNVNIDHSTGVLCGCLKLLIALIEVGGGDMGGNGLLVEGSHHIVQSLGIPPWSRGNFVNHDDNSQWGLAGKLNDNDKAAIDLMGSIFDGFISSARSSGSPPICCDQASRQLAFQVISTAAQACGGGAGYSILSHKINGILSNVAPALRHLWGQNASPDDGSGGSQRTASNNSVKYSGLKNQGCTCYMNSVLQQLFMMPAFRKNLCSARVPTSIRSSGGGVLANGGSLVGKKISLHWENGNKYDANVVRYEESTGMHTVEYCPVQIATGMGHSHHGQQNQQSAPPDVSSLPRDLPEEFVLSKGRPGKETGAFELVLSNNQALVAAANEGREESKAPNAEVAMEVKESDDEASSRKLLEEVQRTFINLDEARGRCFDPRSLVEASHCLKLEFDVWQQNDASEFAMKLLDRLEISLKKWSPTHFRYLSHTFGMKQTKQKICKECGLKTNREADMINIDCQIRGKSSVHEALAAMCEDEIMEGDNKVMCDRCKVKTNTILRTAISSLPNMLVLSLKRFDLDYNTFETVKLNSRCEFGEALNMKQYTLQAKEILEASGSNNSQDESKSEAGSMMEVEESESKDGPDEDPLSVLPDDDYEYKLAGVLVHAGVAQGGHYYSFIKDRTSAKWYRFDDEDVTPFDPSCIEHDCFGGKVKKETKLPNGYSHTVESEQFANALMLFYEKVKPGEFDPTEKAKEKQAHDDDANDTPMDEEPKMELPSNLELSDGYEVFLPEVRKSNSTYSWQSFLLTDEFQAFVKEILDLCTGVKKSNQEDSMDITPSSSPSPVIPGEIDSWRFSVIQMTLSFVFDALFHLPLKASVLDNWSKSLMRIFSSSGEITAMFVADLAKRTHTVYENWIRAYTMECPEEGSRRTALKIFACAISSLLSQENERTLLHTWTQSWSAQVAEKERLMVNKRQHVGALPVKLESPASAQLEDVSSIGVTATSAGIIISFLAELIELSPRYTQANIDLCFLIKELANSNLPSDRKLLRSAMVESQFITRLICIALQGKCHDFLKLAFPGSSVSADVIEAISRNESHSSNMMQVGMNHSSRGGNDNHHDVQTLLEAIGCLLGMPWVQNEPIALETGEVVRGRQVRELTSLAIEALTAVFEETKPESSNGMTAKDVRQYLQKCGHNVPPQQIDQIFARHAVEEPDGTKLLNLKGFLAYYREAVMRDEGQVQKELDLFGFRPNLTRRNSDCRWYADENNVQHAYTLHEQIAIDVAVNHRALPHIHFFSVLGLQALQFLNYAAGYNFYMAEYLLAASAYGKDSQRLILDALNYFNGHIGSWIGGAPAEGYPLILLIFSVLAAMPDDKQEARINVLMMNEDRSVSGGLMYNGNHLVQSYPNNYEARQHVERYLDCVQVLQKQRAVATWMARNPSLCAWMEPEAHPETAHPLQSRSDHSGRRGGGHHQNNMPAHQHIESNAVDDSDIDDEDSRSDDEESHREIVVEGCGVPEINGIYVQAGVFDGVPKYTQVVRYNGRDEEFSLFRCKLTDNTRRWYISIVPMNSHPGTTKDIDFYAAVPSTNDSGHLPPRQNWMCIPNSGGIMPAPRVYPRNIYNESGDDNQAPIVVDPDQSQGYL